MKNRFRTRIIAAVVAVSSVLAVGFANTAATAGEEEVRYCETLSIWVPAALCPAATQGTTPTPTTVAPPAEQWNSENVVLESSDV